MMCVLIYMSNNIILYKNKSKIFYYNGIFIIRFNKIIKKFGRLFLLYIYLLFLNKMILINFLSTKIIK